MRGRVFGFLIVLSLILATSPVAAAPVVKAVPMPVPPRFVGMDVTVPVFTDQVPSDKQFTTMVPSGVETIRIAFNWAGAQPYKDWFSVPVDQLGSFQSGVRGVPTNFSATDQIVATAARHGVTVLPTVLYAPRWDVVPRTDGGIEMPADPRRYADYLTTLTDRYGPKGVFWAHNPEIPRLPIRMWQIWNEENRLAAYPQPFLENYLPLLLASQRAIKAADPGAKVVLGALTGYSWIDLGKLEKIRGAKHLFDYIAVNDFSATVGQVMGYLRLVRRAADRAGDSRKPMIATELSWPSAEGRSDQHYRWDTTEAGQAKEVSKLLPALAAERTQLRLAAFYYYNWMGIEYPNAPAFNFAGLLKFVLNSGKIQVKPALASFKRGALAIEQCRKKGAVATRCIH